MVDPYYAREAADAREEPADGLQQVGLPEGDQTAEAVDEGRGDPRQSIGQDLQVAGGAGPDQQPADRVAAAGPEGAPEQPAQRRPGSRYVFLDPGLFAPDDPVAGLVDAQEEVQVA